MLYYWLHDSTTCSVRWPAGKAKVFLLFSLNFLGKLLNSGYVSTAVSTCCVNLLLRSFRFCKSFKTGDADVCGVCITVATCAVVTEND